MVSPAANHLAVVDGYEKSTMPSPALADAVGNLVVHARVSHELEIPPAQVSEFLQEIVAERSIRGKLRMGIVTAREAVGLVLAHFETSLIFPALEKRFGEDAEECRTKPYSQETMDSVLAFLTGLE